MKKITTILTLLIGFLVSFSSFADAGLIHRSRCRWWSKRYVAWADVREYWVSRSYRRSSGCDYARAYASLSSGYATAWAEASHWKKEAYTISHRWFATAGGYGEYGGFEFSTIDPDITSAKVAHSIEDSISVYDNGFQIHKPKIKLKINSHDELNDFAATRIQVTAVNEEDSTDVILLDEARLFLINREVFKSGTLFNNLAEEVTHEGDTLVVGLSGDAIQAEGYNVPTGYSLQVSVGVDVGNLRLGLPSEYITEEAKEKYFREPKISVLVYPNPVKDLKAHADVNITIEDNYTVKLIGTLGQEYTVGVYHLVEGKNQIFLSFPTTPSGAYTLLVAGKSVATYRRIFVE